MYPDSNWGTASVDYFTNLDTTEIQLRPGSFVWGNSAGGRAILSAVWPNGHPVPSEIFLSTPEASRLRRRPRRPGPMPLISKTEGALAGDADWYVAPVVNTSSGEPGKACSIHVVGQWARLRCEFTKRYLQAWRSLSGLGDKGRDFNAKTTSWLGGAELDFRLRYPAKASVLLELGGGADGNVRLEYEWPEDAPQPTVLSLEEHYR